MIVVRYADDSVVGVVGFAGEAEALRFLGGLKAGLAAFGLVLNQTKTRALEFGRFAADQRKRAGKRRPEMFDFLGFTHICATRRAHGRFIVN